MEQQLRCANEVLEQMVNRMSGDEPPPYIKDMQQQLANMQENMTQTERINQEINDDLHELEVLTARTHQTLCRQQEQAAQLQTVVEPWPSEFADEDRDYVIKYYAQKAGVGQCYTTMHGTSVYGKYKPSPVTILHWANAIAKADFEAYIFRRYNKWHPATIFGIVTTPRFTIIPDSRIASLLRPKLATWRGTSTC